VPGGQEAHARPNRFQLLESVFWGLGSRVGGLRLSQAEQAAPSPPGGGKPRFSLFLSRSLSLFLSITLSRRTHEHTRTLFYRGTSLRSRLPPPLRRYAVILHASLLRVWGSGSGFGVHALGCRLQGLRIQAQGSGCRV